MKSSDIYPFLAPECIEHLWESKMAELTEEMICSDLNVVRLQYHCSY